MRSGPPSRKRRPAAVVFATTLVIACAVPGLGQLGGADAASSAPQPAPAFYLTASSASDLEKQAHDAAARFAKAQGPEHSVLVLDFGAARYKGGDHGTALRSGAFFTNEDIQSALEEAARGYDEAYEQGSVTIVYANTNADLGNPESGYEPFTKDLAQDAGDGQADAVKGYDLPDHVSMAVGGDIEPGFQGEASPDVPIAMVEAAIERGTDTPYYDVGTAPCGPEKCLGGWTVKDLCSVTTGNDREPLPEIYFEFQATDWSHVAKECGIKSFAGVSASRIGTLPPTQSWKTLRSKTAAGVGPVVAEFPG